MLQVGNSTVSEKIYLKTDNRYIQALQVAIQVTDGFVSGYRVYHECLSCTTEECLKDPNEDSDCYYKDAESSPKIFLTFYGTD